MLLFLLLLILFHLCSLILYTSTWKNILSSLFLRDITFINEIMCFLIKIIIYLAMCTNHHTCLCVIYLFIYVCLFMAYHLKLVCINFEKFMDYVLLVNQYLFLFIFLKYLHSLKENIVLSNELT